MADSLDKIPSFEKKIEAMMEIIVTNILLLGQIPSPTFQEKQRTKLFLERLADFQVDECTTDGYRNPIGIIRGTSRTRPPIFITAHMDTIFSKDIDHNYTVNKDSISGAGILDNSAGVGVLASLPEIFRQLDLKFESDIVLAGVIQSIGRGNLRGIRHLLKTWSTPIRAAVCIEGCELGRLNYFSDSMIRGDIECKISPANKKKHSSNKNAILVLNEIINEILMLRLPQKPRSNIIIGNIAGGLKHGENAYEAILGLEIRSDSDKMVRSIYQEIMDIVDGLSHEYEIDLDFHTISNVTASRLKFNHPLVKNAGMIMKKLGLTPVSQSSESELSIFLAHGIPAITLGITHGENNHSKRSLMYIHPMFKGIAQIIGVIMAIDNGVCDE